MLGADLSASHRDGDLSRGIDSQHCRRMSGGSSRQTPNARPLFLDARCGPLRPYICSCSLFFSLYKPFKPAPIASAPAFEPGGLVDVSPRLRA